MYCNDSTTTTLVQEWKISLGLVFHFIVVEVVCCDCWTRLARFLPNQYHIWVFFGILQILLLIAYFMHHFSKVSIWYLHTCFSAVSNTGLTYFIVCIGNCSLSAHPANTERHYHSSVFFCWWGICSGFWCARLSWEICEKWYHIHFYEGC